MAFLGAKKLSYTVCTSMLWHMMSRRVKRLKLDEQGMVHWPILLLYLEVVSSDFIKQKFNLRIMMFIFINAENRLYHAFLKKIQRFAPYQEIHLGLNLHMCM